MKLDYFYGAQVERIMKHLVRLFSNFQIQEGYNDDGTPRYRRVPCRVGDISRQAAVVLHENSENKLPSAPFITVSISNMSLSRANVRAPGSDITAMGVNKKDPATGQYTNQLEGYYEVERYNPVPWDFDIAVDIWTTNQQNKFELFEQIATVFSPSVPFQLSTNPMDPTSMAYVELTDYTHTSRSFPQGTDYNLDISQFQFKTMVFLSLPAKVNRAKLINQIVANTNIPAIDELELPTLTNWKNIATDVFSPGNHMVELITTQDPLVYDLKLLTKHGIDAPNGQMLSWDMLYQYYNPAENSSKFLTLLDTLEQDLTQIKGVLTAGSQPNIQTLTIDEATMEPVNSNFVKFIDPRKTLIADLADGVYIIHEDSESVELSGVILEPNSLVTKSNSNYTVVEPNEGQVAQSSASGRRYKYLKDIGWHEVLKTRYGPGYWRLGFSS